jgi:hypothetical protein
VATLRTEQHPLGQARLEAVRGVELLFEASPSDDDEESFLSDVLNIIQMLPAEQLTLFSLETTHISSNRGHTLDIVSTVLNQHPNTLETLNLPVATQLEYNSSNPSSPGIGANLTLSSVHTLFLANECWWQSTGPIHLEPISNIDFPALRELSVEWRPENINILFSVRPVQNLRKLHIIDYTRHTAKYITTVLDFLPALELLSIFTRIATAGLLLYA